MQFMNGSMSSSIAFNYVLQSRSEGKFTIAPASIEFGGKELQTRPIAIEVTRGTAPQTRQSQQQDQSNLAEQIGDDLFLKITTDKSRIYQGEQITVSYKIYTRVNIVNYTVSKVPSWTGFWSEDLETPQQIRLTDEVINGRQYRVGVLKKVALFPQRAGNLELDPMEVDCVAQLTSRKRSNDVFDQFFNDPFFGNTVNVNRKIRSQPLKISVLPLPAENIPAGFKGAVGKYTMETWLDKREVKANEPATLKIKISGRGNLKLIDAPSFILPPDIERYDPKISDIVSNQEGQMAGSRTFEYLLIPRHEGEYRIPSMEFSFFDTEKKSYTSQKSQEFVLKVTRGRDEIASGAVGMNREDVRLLSEDIRFIRSGNVGFRRIGEHFVGSTLFVASALTPILGFIGFIVALKRRERLSGNMTLLRNRKARKIAQKRLAEAKGFLQQGRREEFFLEVSRALWGFVADKLSMPPAEISLDAVSASLLQRGITEETMQQMSAMLEKCEFARFAPSTDSFQMDDVYKEAARLILTIEEEIQ